jgi:hypothetical protein
VQRAPHALVARQARVDERLVEALDRASIHSSCAPLPLCIRPTPGLVAVARVPAVVTAPTSIRLAVISNRGTPGNLD